MAKNKVEECVYCKTVLGSESKIHPMRTEDAVWCPQCFVYVRAPMEPARYYPNGFRAVMCARCEHKTLDVGPSGACGHCSSRGVIALGPMPAAAS